MSRWRASSLAARASAEQVVTGGTPRRPARASGPRTGRARSWARSTHSTSSNSSSSWFVGVSRCRLRSGRWTITLRSLPTSECTPNSVIAVPPSSLRRRTTLVPARALDDLLDVGERADGGPLAGRLDEPGRGLDLRAHRPGGEVGCAQLAGGHPVEPALLGRAPALVDAVDVGGHDEQVGVDLAGEQLAGEVLVDHRLDAGERALLARHPRGRDAAAAGADHHDAVVEQPADRPDLEDPLRRRRRDDAAEVVAVALEHPALLGGERLGLRRRRRSGRRTWSGRRTPGRRRRPRSSSGSSRTAPRPAAGCRAPAR